MPRPRRSLRTPALVLAATLAIALSATGCGPDEDRVSLAVTGPAWTPTGQLVLRTECADITETTITPGVDGAPPTVTVWGAPKMGRCHPQIVLDVDPGTTKIVDAATSQVIDLPSQP